jgi:Family of unknown function (DUF5723)/Thrombospondin type 3 repeat
MKKIFYLQLFLLLAYSAVAQRELGIATGNYSGLSSLYLNPANIADSRDKFTIDLFSVNIGADNNLGSLKISGALNHFLNAKGENSNSSFSSDDIFNYSSHKQFSMLAPYGEIRLPGFKMTINRKHSIALTARIRGVNQLNNFDQSLYRAINSSRISDFDLTSANFNWTAQIWSEIGLTYGVVLLDQKKHLLKAAITLRYLGGIGFLSADGSNLSAHYYSANDSLKAYNTHINFASNILNSDNLFQNKIKPSDLFSRFLGSGGGSGVGADIGVVYEYRPHVDKYRYEMDGKTGLVDPSKNAYTLRVSASVTDIGAINYTSNNVSAANVNANGYLSANDLRNNINSYNDFRNYALSHGFSVDTSVHGSTKVHLPTCLLMGADYHVYRGFFVNALYVGNVVDRNNAGNSFYNQFTVTPRFEVKAFTIGVPITYSALSQSMKAGIGIRAGGFFFGSDDMLAFLGNNQYGFNFYFGGSVSLYRHKPRDRDNDHVSDKRDHCPDTPGEWAFHGCPDPDRDHDGIPDSVDRCPDDSGARITMGCPDQDGDSVADMNDRCPTDAGPVALKGCPDRDHDGIADMDDHCPDVPGLTQFGGCPDPDRDHDGVPDSIDKCPDVAGAKTAMGCPDRDRDSVADNEDRCPDAPGPKALKGCPDRDADGVADMDDKCPDVYGTMANNGCPEAQKEQPKAEEKKEEAAHAPLKASERKLLNKVATAIQFQTGKALIKKTSYAMLDQIVKLLNEYTDYYMTIDGYTDNVGKPEKNLKL